MYETLNPSILLLCYFKLKLTHSNIAVQKISQPFQHGEVAKLRDTVHVTKTIHLHFSHTKNSQQVLCLTGWKICFVTLLRLSHDRFAWMCIDAIRCIHLCVRKREWNIPYLRNSWHCIIPIHCSFNSIWGKDGNPKNILRPKKGIEDIILILLLR